MKHKALLAIALSLTTTPVQAEDVWIDFKLPSYTFEDTYIEAGVEKEFSTTYGVGISYPVNNYIEWRGGVYNNRLGNTAVYGYGNLHTSSSKPFYVGINLGFETGKADPLTVIPHITYQHNNVRFEVGYDFLSSYEPSEQITVLPEYESVPVEDRENFMYGTTSKYTNEPAITFTVGIKF